MNRAYQIAQMRTGAASYDKDYEKVVDDCISTFDAGSTKQGTVSAGRCAGEGACAYFSAGLAPTGTCGDFVAGAISAIWGDAEAEEKKRRQQAVQWDKYFGAEDHLRDTWIDYAIAMYNRFFKETKLPPYELQRLLNKNGWPSEEVIDYVQQDKIERWDYATLYAPPWYIWQPLRLSVGIKPGQSNYDSNLVTDNNGAAWKAGYQQSLLRLDEMQRKFKRAYMRATIAPISKAVAQKYASENKKPSSGGSALPILLGLGGIGLVLVKVLR